MGQNLHKGLHWELQSNQVCMIFPESSYTNLSDKPLLIGTGHCQPMKDCLSAEELLIVNSYWPMNDKKRLNKFQRKAIQLAWDNKFTMIQGPPGVCIF